jgi:hypothetical protein
MENEIQEMQQPLNEVGEELISDDNCEAIQMDMWCPDCLYPSDNELEVPTLRTDMQAKECQIPFLLWGEQRRTYDMCGSGTLHFYCHDYCFGDSLYQHPEKILQQNPANIVEPNYSLFQETPIAFGIQAIYKKRMIARALQDKGIRVFVDMNVAAKWYQFNMLGVPRGWTAYCTRGYADRIDYLKFEVNLARYWADGNQVLFVVYGGGQDVKRVCREEGLVYVNPTLKMKKSKDAMKKIGETVAFFGQQISLSMLNPGMEQMKQEMKQIEDFTTGEDKSLR